MVGVRHNQAISAALTLVSSPALLDPMRRHPLPDDVLELLYVFSGDDDAIDYALSWCGTTEMQLMAAIENYVQRVMVFEGAHADRILGLSKSSDRDAIRLHFKLLMRGLHPDQSGDPWRASFASRAIEAWKSLSSGQELPDYTPAKRRSSSVGSLSFITHAHEPRRASFWGAVFGMFERSQDKKAKRRRFR